MSTQFYTKLTKSIKNTARVSKILDKTEEKSDALKEWIKNTPKEEREAISKKYRDMGTKLHKQLELQAVDRIKAIEHLSTFNDEEMTRLSNFMSFTRRYTPLKSELKFIFRGNSQLPYEYRGAIDSIGILDAKDLDIDIQYPLCLLDWKSLKKQKPPQWQIRYYLQLAAYSYAATMTDEFVINNAVLVTVTDRSCKLHYLSPSKLEFYIKWWLEAVKCFYEKTKFPWKDFLYRIGYRESELGYPVIFENNKFPEIITVPPLES